MADVAKFRLVANADGRKLPLPCLKKYVGNGMLSEAVDSSSGTEVKDEAAGHLRNVSEDLEIVHIRARPTSPDEASITDGEGAANVVQVNDIVGPIVTEGQLEHPSYLAIPDAGVLLVMKACGSLSSMGYDATTTAKVGQLVAENMMTAVHYRGFPVDEDAVLNSEDWIEQRVGYTLSSMLSHDQRRLRSVNINSNEPVVLINSFGGLSEPDLEKLVTVTNDKLQQQWNIWPVRIYAASFFELPAHSSFRDFGFSISLLNVVNTEIGGPSMIQLLDFNQHEHGWLGRLRHDGRHHKGENKIYIGTTSAPEVKHTNVSAQNDPSADFSSEGSHAGSFSEDSDDDAPIDVPQQAETPEPASTTPPHHEESYEDSRATFAERSQESGPQIQYPTWQHASHDESLLDLIRRQASNADDSNRDEHRAETESDASSPHSQDAKSEEGFVVV